MRIFVTSLLLLGFTGCSVRMTDRAIVIGQPQPVPPPKKAAKSKTKAKPKPATPKPAEPVLVLSEINFKRYPVVADDAQPQPGDLFVALTGSDTNPGTENAPFATLEKARDAIRDVEATGQTVWIRGGIYPRTETFVLGAEDSNVTYRGWPGERVTISGGRSLTGARKSKGNIYEVDLTANGISDFGRLAHLGHGQPARPVAPELFFDGKPMQLARFPNKGWLKITGTPDGRRGTSFNTDTSRLEVWSKAPDLWLHGLWYWAWSDSYLKVCSIDVTNQTIEICDPQSNYGYQVGGLFYALNVLEELDVPGEYYLDRSTGTLSVWPPAAITDENLVLSVLEEPLVAVQGAANVTLQGLTFEFARGTGVEVSGGSNVLVAGCTFRNLGAIAVEVDDDSVACGVSGCDIYEVGQGGVMIEGGDRRTLTPGRNFAVNNHIYNFNRVARTYKPGVRLTGVGNLVANNWIHSAPHFGIWLNGNDHIIEYNEIYNVCTHTEDAGAIYMGRDVTEQGNVIRFNYLHDIRGPRINAIYLDDCTSGTEVQGNIFQRVDLGVMMNGGGQNQIENNLFLNANLAARAYRDKTVRKLRGVVWERVKAMTNSSPLYVERYPMLQGVFTNEMERTMALLSGNRFERNVCYRARKCTDFPADNIATNNLVGTDPRFVDPSKGDFGFLVDSPAIPLDIEPVPFEKIGLYRDKYRPTLRVEP